LGTVILASDYNVLHASYSTQREMENSMFASFAKPSENVIHPIECAASETPIDKLYVRSSGVNVAGGDLRLYDLCFFYVATVGLPASAPNIGELWVSYEVEFFKPTLPGSIIPGNMLGANVQYLNNIQNSSSWTSFTSPTNSFFGTSLACYPIGNALGNLFPGNSAADKDNYLVKTSVTTYPRVTWGNDVLAYPYIYLQASDSTNAGINTIMGVLDSVPHKYFIEVWFANATAAAITHPTVTYDKCSILTGQFIAVSNSTDTLTSPAAGQTSSFVSYFTTFTTQAVNPSANEYYWTIAWTGGALPSGVTPAANIIITQVW
jgi:hypothetical protein